MSKTLQYKKPHIPNFDRLAKAWMRIARNTAQELVMEFADENADTFRRKILAQQFESFHAIPLSPEYLARKVAKHADVRTLVATGHYVRSIRVFKEVNADGSLTVHVGFAPDAHAHDLDGHVVPILLKDVARVQEHGSAAAHVPARAHWGPHAQVMRQAAPSIRRTIVEQVVDATRLSMKRGR